MCLTSPTTLSTSSFLGYSSDSVYGKSGLDSPASISLDSALKEADGAYRGKTYDVMSRARCFNFAMGFEEEREDESWVPKECCRADEPDSSLRRWRVDDILEPSSDRNPEDRFIGSGSFGELLLVLCLLVQARHAHRDAWRQDRDRTKARSCTPLESCGVHHMFGTQLSESVRYDCWVHVS